MFGGMEGGVAYPKDVLFLKQKGQDSSSFLLFTSVPIFRL